MTKKGKSDLHRTCRDWDARPVFIWTPEILIVLCLILSLLSKPTFPKPWLRSTTRPEHWRWLSSPYLSWSRMLHFRCGAPARTYKGSVRQISWRRWLSVSRTSNLELTFVLSPEDGPLRCLVRPPPRLDQRPKSIPARVPSLGRWNPLVTRDSCSQAR